MLQHTNFEGRIALLSDKHIDVLQRIAMHKSSKLIARELGISQFTVDQRARRIMKVLDVRSRKEAANLYLAVGSGAATNDNEAQAGLTAFNKTIVIACFMVLFAIAVAVLVNIAEALSRIY